MRIVEVTWLDAADHGDTWVDRQDAEDFTERDCKVVSIGYFIKETPKYVTIGSDWDESDNNFGTVRKIPKGMIQDIKDV